jgi:hypothetical protein
MNAKNYQLLSFFLILAVLLMSTSVQAGTKKVHGELELEYFYITFEGESTWHPQFGSRGENPFAGFTYLDLGGDLTSKLTEATLHDVTITVWAEVDGQWIKDSIYRRFKTRRNCIIRRIWRDSFSGTY